MTVLGTVGTVERHEIREVVGNDRFKINNLLDHRQEPRDRGVIVRDARRLVGWELPYNAATFNCEHFVTGLRYGEVGGALFMIHSNVVFQHLHKILETLIHKVMFCKDR